MHVSVYPSVYLYICLCICPTVRVFSPLGLWVTCSSLLSELVRLNMFEEEFAKNFRKIFLNCKVFEALEGELDHLTLPYPPVIMS